MNVSELTSRGTIDRVNEDSETTNPKKSMAADVLTPASTVGDDAGYD